MSPKTDEWLYEQYLNGEDEALRELLVRYEEGLILFLNLFVHNMQDAEELALDAFAALGASGKHFRNRCSFKTWLYAIGRKLAYKHYRKNRKIIPTSGINSLEAVTNYTPESEMLRRENYLELYAGMAKLKQEYQDALYLSFFEDMDRIEVARVMHKSEKQISDLLYRGKQSLRTIMMADGFEYTPIETGKNGGLP